MSEYDYRRQSQQPQLVSRAYKNTNLNSMNSKNKPLEQTNRSNLYYPIQQQVQCVQSRIVSQQNNSILMSNMNSNLSGNNNVTKMNAFQVSAQQYNCHDQQLNENTNNMLPQQSNIMKRQQSISNNNNNNSSLQSFQQRPYINNRTNKLQVVSESNTNNNSTLNQQQNKHTQSTSSLNKRSQSITRGGIKVVSNNSRNSSIEKKSQTSSIQKNASITNITKDKNNQNITLGGMPMCGVVNNCKTRSPFIQAEQNNQIMIVPNLGSIQTLTSQFVNMNKEVMSDRVNINNTYNYRQKNNTNSSQITNIELSSNNISYLMNGTGINNNQPQSTQKLYKHLREMMQKQLTTTKRMYQKKCIDQVQSMNLLYQSQIETLQRVLAENQTLIQHQQKKIQRLQDKCVKSKQKMNAYGDRLQSIHKYIQSTNKFTIERLNETQLKYTLMLQQLHRLNLTQNQSTIFTNKLQHLQTIFTTLITHTITKYHNIQTQIKQQIKDMMKKYQYYEEKIYEMDLMKHLGKENQIQNYKLIEKIQGLREQMALVEKRISVKGEMGSGMFGKSMVENIISQVKKIQQFDQLKKMLYKLQGQTQFWQRNQQQQFTKINKLQVDKYRLTNKINELTEQLERNQSQIQRLNQQNYRLRQIQRNQQVRQQQQQQKQEQKCNYTQSGQKQFNLAEQKKYYEFSSQKKSQFHLNQTQQQLNNNNIKYDRQIQQLHEIIDQYQCKIQQLHGAIEQLQQQNINLLQQLNNNNKSLTSQQEKGKLSTEMKVEQQSIIVSQLKVIIQQKQHQLQQALQTIQQSLRQKQQLNHALQMTQHIFDQQVIKFKQTIHKLQQENQLLINLLNDLRQESGCVSGGSRFNNNNMMGQLARLQQSSSISSSSINSQNINKKITMSKSPKKQIICETVTMGWFKKNVMQQKEEMNNSQINNKNKNNNININSNSNSQNNKIKIRQVLSPQHNRSINNSNSYNFINTDRSQYQHHSQYHNQGYSQQLSASNINEFFYPNSKQQHKQQQYQNNGGSKRKIQSLHTTTKNQVKHTQSLPSNIIQSAKVNHNNINNFNNLNYIKLNKLNQALTQNNNYSKLPVQCILDSQGRLQLYQTGKYIVDDSYTTFQLSKQQLITAEKMGLIYMIDENVDSDDLNNHGRDDQKYQQQHQQQGEHYIF